MRVLVTGGHGFVGSHLLDRLAAEGVLLRCLVRGGALPDVLRQTGAEVVRGDLRGAGGLDAALEGADAVVHLAALTRSRTRAEMRATNVRGTAALLAAAARARLPGPFVLCSSLAAVGPSGDGPPHDAAVPPRPRTWYGESKRDAERLALAHAGRLDVRIVRPPAVYGPRDRDFLAVFRAVDRGLLPLLGDPGQRLHLVHAADLAEALAAVLRAPAIGAGPWYPAHPEVVTAEGFGRSVAAALGRRSLRPVRLPLSLLRLAGRAGDLLGQVARRPPLLTSQRAIDLEAGAWLCDAAPLEAATGWRARRDVATGTRETADWYRQAGWLPRLPGSR